MGDTQLLITENRQVIPEGIQITVADNIQNLVSDFDKMTKEQIREKLLATHDLIVRY